MALSNDDSSRVRSSLTRNPHLPLEILARLAEDIESKVRIQIAYNTHTHTPKEILIKLAQDSDVLVRFVSLLKYLSDRQSLITVLEILATSSD